jgi:hypothetical protein
MLPLTDQHRLLLSRHVQVQLSLNLEKCVFAVAQLDFLGHCISAPGIAALQRRYDM